MWGGGGGGGLNRGVFGGIGVGRLRHIARGMRDLRSLSGFVWTKDAGDAVVHLGVKGESR